MRNAERRTSRWLGRTAWAVAAALPLAFLALFFLWPVASLLAVGFGGGIGADRGGAFSLDGFQAIFAESRTWRVIAQTLAQAVCGALLSVLLGVPAAFVLYRLEFRGRMLLRGLATVPFVLPTVVVGIAFTALLGPGAPLAFLGLDQSFIAIVLALAFFNVTLVARTVGGFWGLLDPRAEQAARMLGASPTRAFVTVTLPALAPAIASAASLAFLFCATSFGIVLVLGGRTFSNVETEIYRLTVQYLDLRSAAALSIVQVVLVLLVLVVSTRLRRRRERAVEMRFEASRPVRPSRSNLPAILIFAVTTLLLHVLPILTLVLRSLRDAEGRFSIVNYAHLAAPPDQARLGGTVLDAIGLSLRFAVAATAIALVLGLLVALVASRRPRSGLLRRGIETLDGLVMLPLGVSAVTVGFGLLLTMHRPLGIGFDLRTSVVLIPIAQALVALPLVVRALLPVLRGIDPKQREAAAMLGAAPARVLRTVDLRVLGRPLGLATGFAFATSLGEFGATAFLVRPGEQTLPVMLAHLIGRQGADNYGMALAAAVVLGVVTAAVMLIAERWRGSSAGEI
ncbi:ABC transporter permease [Leucobacter sp. GX24907]